MKENLHLKTLKIIIIFISIIALLFISTCLVLLAFDFLDCKYGSTVACSVALFFIFIGFYCLIYEEVKDDYKRQKYYEKLIKKREQNKED